MEVFTVVKRNPFVIPLAFAVALVMVFISEGSYWRSVDTFDKIGAMAMARLNIFRLQHGILDAETAQRGYLLTGRKSNLQPYEAGTRSVGEALKALELHYSKRPDSAAMLGQLHSLIDIKLRELATTIDLHDQGRQEARTELALNRIDVERMAEIRTLLAKLYEVEVHLVVKGRENIYRTLLLNRVGVALLSAISLLALVMYLRESFALDRQQQQQKLLDSAKFSPRFSQLL